MPIVLISFVHVFTSHSVVRTQPYIILQLRFIPTTWKTHPLSPLMEILNLSEYQLLVYDLYVPICIAHHTVYTSTLALHNIVIRKGILRVCGKAAFENFNWEPNHKLGVGTGIFLITDYKYRINLLIQPWFGPETDSKETKLTFHEKFTSRISPRCWIEKSKLYAWNGQKVIWLEILNKVPRCFFFQSLITKEYYIKYVIIPAFVPENTNFNFRKCKINATLQNWQNHWNSDLSSRISPISYHILDSVLVWVQKV